MHTTVRVGCVQQAAAGSAIAQLRHSYSQRQSAKATAPALGQESGSILLASTFLSSTPVRCYDALRLMQEQLAIGVDSECSQIVGLRGLKTHVGPLG